MGKDSSCGHAHPRMSESRQTRPNSARYVFIVTLSRHHLLEVFKLVEGSRDCGTAEVQVTEEVKEAWYVFNSIRDLAPFEPRCFQFLTIGARGLNFLTITDAASE